MTTVTDVSLNVRRSAERADVRITGSLLLTGAPALRQQLDDLIGSGVRVVQVDLANVHDVDRGGLVALILARRRLRGCNGKLRLVALSDECRDLIRRLHLFSGEFQ
jgi:anti-anti-sigma regulatory factor